MEQLFTSNPFNYPTNVQNYFEHPEDREAMDNLMLSHGWRRFRWEEVLRRPNPSFEFPPEYNGAIISGKLMNTRTGIADKNVLAYLSVPGTRTQFSAATSDDQGRIKFELKDFYGGQELIVQTNPLVDSLFRVDIANPFSEIYGDTQLPPFAITPLNSTALTDKSVAIQVLNRYGGEKLKHFHFPAADTTIFYYKPDNTYLLDDYTRFTTMEEVMREYVTKMLVQRRGGHFHLPLFDLPNTQVLERNYLELRVFDKDPLVLLDGVPIFNMDSVFALDPLKIRKLEAVHSRYFLGTASFDGILNWTTYKGDFGGYILDPRATVVDYEGPQLHREFYSPSYATAEETASHLPDFRNVLYWSPVVTADPQGKGELSFYSSDIPGRYVVVVEALAADGSAGTSIFTFELK